MKSLKKDTFRSERETMVQTQLIRRNITDKRVLAAMRKIPRDEFVPESHKKRSYNDSPLAIGNGQTISQPYMVASMTELLALSGSETVLEVGTGSGYQAAILAELADTVYSIERFSDLSRYAHQRLQKCGYTNVFLKTGDGSKGWQEYAPYDRIIVTAGAPKIPPTLLLQLQYNGKLVIPVGSQYSQELTLVVKNKKGGNRVQKLYGCIFVPLIGKEGWEK
ncbi:protein-L-isoaspartate(D-aspartate) O-methyltransferase [Chlamydiota bacterium]